MIVKSITNILIPFILLFSISQPVSAKRVESPPDLSGARVVTAEQAYRLMKKGVLMVDARVAHEYVDERIKGAINIPYKEKSAKLVKYNHRLDRFDLKKLPKEKSTPVIFYCNAGTCWKSYKACRAAIQAGYRKVYWLRGEIPEWKVKGLPIE